MAGDDRNSSMKDKGLAAVRLNSFAFLGNKVSSNLEQQVKAQYAATQEAATKGNVWEPVSRVMPKETGGPTITATPAAAANRGPAKAMSSPDNMSVNEALMLVKMMVSKPRVKIKLRLSIDNDFRLKYATARSTASAEKEKTKMGRRPYLSPNAFIKGFNKNSNNEPMLDALAKTKPTCAGVAVGMISAAMGWF